MRYFIFYVFFVVSVLIVTQLNAEQVSHEVVFDPDSSVQQVEFEQRITGGEFKDYIVSGEAGDILNVTLSPSNLSNNFNIYPLGSEQAVFIGAIKGHYVRHQLAKGGDYVVRVYLMRNAARRNESSDYKLTIVKQLAEFAPRQSMHPSWDKDGDDINDCENEGSCDHTIDYTKARPQDKTLN